MSILSVNGQVDRIARVQFSIDSLVKPPGNSKDYEIYPERETLMEFWNRISSEYYFTCNGDICYEKRFGLINTQNQDTLDPIFKSIDLYQQKIFIASDKWVALLNDQLKVVMAFENANRLSNDYISVSHSNFWGVLDSALNEVLPPKYEDIRLYERGFGFAQEKDLVPYFIVREKRRWGMITPTKEIVIPIAYDEVSNLSYPFLSLKKGKYGLAKSDGKLVSPFKYDTIYNDFSMATFVVGLNNRLGLISMEGKEMTPIIYTSVGKQGENGCRCVRKDGKWGVISSAGKELTPFVYEEVKWYNLNQIPLRKNNKWGFYDCQNKKESTPFIYDRLVNFYGYEADVLLNGITKRIKLE
jgi:hypothetical protein